MTEIWNIKLPSPLAIRHTSFRIDIWLYIKMNHYFRLLVVRVITPFDIINPDIMEPSRIFCAPYPNQTPTPDYNRGHTSIKSLLTQFFTIICMQVGSSKDGILWRDWAMQLHPRYVHFNYSSLDDANAVCAHVLMIVRAIKCISSTCFICVAIKFISFWWMIGEKKQFRSFK